MPHRYSEQEIQTLMDKMAIMAVLDRYFYGLGRLDAEIMLSCFTDDAKYGPAEGLDALRAIFQDIHRFQHVFVHPVTRNVAINGVEAEVDMQAIGFVFRGDGGSPGPHGRVMVQGIRYNDVLVRTSDGWKIKNRIGSPTRASGHDTLWQFDVASVPVHLD